MFDSTNLTLIFDGYQDASQHCIYQSNWILKKCFTDFYDIYSNVTKGNTLIHFHHVYDQHFC